MSGQHVQGVDGGGLHPAGSDPVDEGVLLLDAHAGRIEHLHGPAAPSAARRRTSALELLDHLAATVLLVGRLDDRLGVDPGDPLGTGVEASGAVSAEAAAAAMERLCVVVS